MHKFFVFAPSTFVQNADAPGRATEKGASCPAPVSYGLHKFGFAPTQLEVVPRKRQLAHSMNIKVIHSCKLYPRGDVFGEPKLRDDLSLIVDVN